MEGSDYCWFHAPEIDYDRSEARKKGGIAKRAGLYSPLPAIPLKQAEDVPELIMDTIRQVRGGFINAKMGLTVGYLAVKLLKSFETLEITGKIKKMEGDIEELKKTKRKRIRKLKD
jgi:hypothetical protein